MFNKKVCIKCGAIKNLTDFNKRTASKDGHTSRCKKCLSLYKKEYYKKYGKQEYLRTKVSSYASAHK